MKTEILTRLILNIIEKTNKTQEKAIKPIDFTEFMNWVNLLDYRDFYCNQLSQQIDFYG